MRLTHVEQVEILASADACRELDRRQLGNRLVLRCAVDRHSAERLVIDELANLPRAARRAFGIAPPLQRPELHPQGIHEQQPSDERLADTKNELDRLVRLDDADESR